VTAHIVDLYAYLSARALGTQGRGARPVAARDAESIRPPDNGLAEASSRC